MTFCMYNVNVHCNAVLKGSMCGALQTELPMAAALLLKLEYKIMRTKTPNIFDVCLRDRYIFINVVR